MKPDRDQDAIADAAMDWHIALTEAEGRAAPVVAFQAWLDRDIRHARAWEQLVALLNSPTLHAAAVADAARLPPLPPQRAAGMQRGALRWSWHRCFASGFALVALASFMWIAGPGLLLRWQADVLTAAGEMRVVALPDGSRADLNSDTAMAFDFTEGRRHVDLLQGEAWFDVIHDPAHPFTVEVDDTVVTVKGTAFAVRAMEGESLVILERGSVQIVRGADQVVLSPGQMVGMGEGLPPAPVASDPGRALAWREGWVLVQEQRFPEALAELSRHYPGRVLDLSSAADRVVSGSFRTDDAEAAIRSIAAASGVSVSRMPGGVLILR